MKIEFIKLDHIQLTIPIGEEQKAREFYCDILGMEEIEKPEPLRKNGGFWLEAAGIQIHIGAENPCCKTKRHPAFEVKNLEEVKNYLLEKDIKMKEEVKLQGVNRYSFYDYWENKIELLERTSE